MRDLFLIMPIVIVTYLVSNQLKCYDYKITNTMIELVSWQEAMIFGLYFCKILLWVLVAVCLIFLVIEPSVLLVGFGGIMAVGASAGTKLFSKDYIQTHLKYEHIVTHWDTVEKIKIDTSRHLILIFGIDGKNKKRKINLINLFCTKQNFNQIEQLVKFYTQNNQDLELIYGEAYGS